jgi:hypothetical protein
MSAEKSSFEKNMAELEKCSKALSEENISLEDAIKYFEKGIEIKNPQPGSQRGDHEVAIQNMASLSSADPFSLHENLLPA